MNSAAVSIHAGVFFGHMIFIFIGYIQRSGIARAYGKFRQEQWT